MLYSLIKSLLLPPVGLFLLILLGVAWWRRPLLGRGLVFLSTVALLTLSLPIVSHKLMLPLEPYLALSVADLERSQAQAIVVLAAGRNSGAFEYGGDSIGPITLQRIRYGAWLQRRTGLPLLVSGGSPSDRAPTLARMMADVLEQAFGVPVAMIEDRSRNTRENAMFSARILRQHGLQRIFLVSSAWHLPRAVAAFEQEGLAVTPAPTAFEHRDFSDGVILEDFLPGPKALQRSYYAIHEYLGRLWYALRGRPAGEFSSSSAAAPGSS